MSFFALVLLLVSMRSCEADYKADYIHKNPEWEAFKNAVAHGVALGPGVKFVGLGFHCVDSKGHPFPRLTTLQSLLDYKKPTDGVPRGILLRDCMAAALAAVAIETEVVGFEFSGFSQCKILFQPGFVTENGEVARVVGKFFKGKFVLEGARDKGYGPISKASDFHYSIYMSDPQNDGHQNLCFSVERKAPPKPLKDAATKMCEGSGNGHEGTGQVGSVCCPGPAGTCCVVGVAGTTGNVETKVECSGDSSKLWSARDGELISGSSTLIPSIAVVGSSLTILVAAIRWTRGRSSVMEVDLVEDKEIEDVE